MRDRSKPDGKANGHSNGKASRIPVVIKLGPERSEARDEGPRLLPLDGVRRPEHYGRAIELADIALGNTPSQPKRFATTRPRVTRHEQPAKSALKGRPSDA